MTRRLQIETTVLLIMLTACGGGGGGGGSNEPITDSAMKTLNWTPPSTRQDGKFLPLSSIAGYIIYFGTDETNLQQVVDIEDMTVTSYTHEAPDSSGYYFGVTAYDYHGLESEMSNLVVK
ncbi:MAG: hypothetical protein AB2598_08680 [Candidatus Thiodiazotropha sp.]